MVRPTPKEHVQRGDVVRCRLEVRGEVGEEDRWRLELGVVGGGVPEVGRSRLSQGGPVEDVEDAILAGADEQVE